MIPPPCRPGAAALLVMCLMASRALAADGLTITRSGERIDIDIAAAQPVDQVVAELASSYRAAVKGSAGAARVGPLHLVDVTLAQALSQILPDKAFALRFASETAAPAQIIIMERSAGSAPPPRTAPPLTDPQAMFRGAGAPGMAGNRPMNQPNADPQAQYNAANGPGPGMAGNRPINPQQRALCLLRSRQMQPGQQNGGSQENAEGNACPPQGAVPAAQ